MSCVRDNPEREVIELLRPSRIQVSMLNRLYELIKNRLETCSLLEDVEFSVELQGSLAKGTILSDTWEIDVFVLFKGVDRGWVAVEGFERLARCLRGLPTVTRYAEHPYVTVLMGGLEADVVPSIGIEGLKPAGARLGVERTPFHTRYVASKLSRCARDEVRLLKSFFKGIGVYGAESHVGGFSGYVCELLVAYYGSFRGALEGISRWSPGAYIDVENIGDREVLLEKYRESPILIVDPVDPLRNAAASITMESLARAVAAARLYLENPDKGFFHVFEALHKGSLLKTLRGLDGISIALVECEGSFYEMPPENVHGRLKRASRTMQSILENHGLPVILAEYYWNEADVFSIAAILENHGLSTIEALKGPEAWTSKERFHSFMRKRASERALVAVSSSGRLLGVRRRAIASVNELLETKVLPQLPLPAGIRSCRARTCLGTADCSSPGIGEILWKAFRLTPVWNLYR